MVSKLKFINTVNAVPLYKLMIYFARHCAIHFCNFKEQNTYLYSEEGPVLEMSAFKLFTGANLCNQLSW